MALLKQKIWLCGDNLDESTTLNSQSLVVMNSNISDWHADPKDNNDVQDVNELSGGFCYDDPGDYDFSLDDLGLFDAPDWMMAYLNSNQEDLNSNQEREQEPIEDNTHKPRKRKFELEENLHQAKKMPRRCLLNDY